MAMQYREGVVLFHIEGMLQRIPILEVHCISPYFHTWKSSNSHVLYVTVYEKTRHMGFFVKIKFDVYLISSTLELTYLQV